MNVFFFGFWLHPYVNIADVRLDWKESRPGFLAKFIETHLVMFSNNRNLRPKADVEFVSRPWMWPIAYRVRQLTT